MKDSSSEIFFLPPLAIRLNGSPEKLFPRALLFNFFRQVLIIFNFFFRHRFFFMAPLRILILGHSFTRRLHVFLRQNFNEVFARNLHIDGDLSIKWHGIGGRTISKVIRHDLGIVEKFAPEIVVIQLGTNDLSSLSAPTKWFLIATSGELALKWFLNKARPFKVGHFRSYLT